MGTFSRREVLIGVAAGAVAACVRSPEHGTEHASPPPPVPPTDPNVLQPAWLETTIGDTPVRLRAYNGQVPGPTLTFTPGTTGRITLRNRLVKRGPGGDPPVHNVDVPHDFEGTNLHFHGMDILPHLFDPVGTSDPLSKMISVPPGGDFDYSFTVPADHPPGLYWYHPHQHGSTAVQAVSGMAGPIIVTGPIDEVPEIKAARDIVMAMQDIGLFQSDETGDTHWTYNPQPRKIWQTFGGVVQQYNATTKTFETVTPALHQGYTTGDYALRYLLLNGKAFFKETHNPDFPTAPIAQQLAPQDFQIAQGEVVRVRMLNGCSDNFMPVHVEGLDMHVLALDGVNFPEPRIMKEVQLAPGNRVEFLLKGPATAGKYAVVQAAQNVQFLQSDRKVIATITVTSETKPMALPASLPVPTRYYPAIAPGQVLRPPRVVTFSTQFRGPRNPEVGMDFMIDGKLYSEQVAGIEVDLNTAVEWHLTLPAGESEGHPFHIHVNHFEVISVNGVAEPPGTIKDTVWIPKPSATQASVVVVRMRFKEFTGKSVFHCHILPHEDTGMMSNFTIRPPALP